MLNLPLNVQGFNFDVMDNPRPSDYEMGNIQCDVCACRTSYYLSIVDEAICVDNPISLNICKSCLTDFINSMNRRMLDDIKKRPMGNAVRGKERPREND